MSEMTKPTTPVNATDCRTEPDQKVVNETTLEHLKLDKLKPPKKLIAL